jgi:hypothetical protein
MPPTTPPLDFSHLSGQEIATKHKEAIRQLYGFAKVPVELLMTRYGLVRSTVEKILRYDAPERTRINRTGRPSLLTDSQVDQVIEYASESWEHRILNFTLLHNELELQCSIETLERRLKQRGYFRYVACQKPYLIAAQVTARLIWAIAHIFWTTEWLKVLWSDEVTFLVGGRTAKERVTRKGGERCHPTCIQHQLHRGHTTPVNAWGAIGYGYKSPLIFVHGSGKKRAFTQKDYLSQVLAHI